MGMIMRGENHKRLNECQLPLDLFTPPYKRLGRAATPPLSPTDSTASTVSTVTTSSIVLDEQESVCYLLKSFSWSLWVGPLPIHSLPIAGGHENQWLLPRGVSELGRVAKLTCLNEAYFYDWIYKKCGRVLPMHNKLFECTGKVLKSLKGNNINKILTKSCLRSGKNSKSHNPFYEVLLKTIKSENSEFKLENEFKLVNAKINLKRSQTLGISGLKVSKNTNLRSKILNLQSLSSDTRHFMTMFKYLPPCYSLCIEDGMVAITLGNVTHGMGRPIVMDLKMGTRLFGGDCTDESVIRIKEEKAMQRSTKTHGFHISGMYIWDKLNRLASFLPVDLAHAAKDDLLLLFAFEKFFFLPLEASSRQKLLSKFISLLVELRQLFQNQLGFAFYGSSLLFVYDSACSNPWNNAKIYMIDFAHVSPSNALDEGYLKGLDSLIRLCSILSHN